MNGNLSVLNFCKITLQEWILKSVRLSVIKSIPYFTSILFIPVAAYLKRLTKSNEEKVFLSL